MQNISIQSKCSRDVLGRVWVKKLHPLQPETITLKGLKLWILLSLFSLLYHKNCRKSICCRYSKCKCAENVTVILLWVR